MSLKDNATWKAVKPFMNGGLSGMGATCIIQPLDIVKVRAVTSTPPRRREGRADCARRRDDRRRATPAATPRGAFHSTPDGVDTRRDRARSERRARSPSGAPLKLRSRAQPSPDRPAHLLRSNRFSNPNLAVYVRSVEPKHVDVRTNHRSAFSSAPPAALSRSRRTSSRTRASARSTPASPRVFSDKRRTPRRVSAFTPRLWISSRNRTRARLCLWFRKPARGSPRAVSARFSAHPRICP
jgi:hypothetical protein